MLESLHANWNKYPGWQEETVKQLNSKNEFIQNKDQNHLQRKAREYRVDKSKDGSYFPAITPRSAFIADSFYSILFFPHRVFTSIGKTADICHSVLKEPNKKAQLQEKLKGLAFDTLVVFPPFFLWQCAPSLFNGYFATALVTTAIAYSAYNPLIVRRHIAVLEEILSPDSLNDYEESKLHTLKDWFHAASTGKYSFSRVFCLNYHGNEKDKVKVGEVEKNRFEKVESK